MHHHDRSVLPDVRKIVVMRPNAVGDFIFALPALHALKQAYPDSEIVYIGKQWHADFLSDRPGPVDRVAVLPPCPGIGIPADAAVDLEPVNRFVEQLKEECFDLAIQMYGGGRYANPFLLQLGARTTIGLKAANAIAPDRWVAFDHLQNRRLQLLELVSLVGASSLTLDQELVVTQRDRQEAAQALPGIGQAPLVVIQPGASDRRRHWPAARFAAIADALAQEGAQIAVNGTLEEAAVVREVIQAMHHPATDLSGKLSLSGLCGVLEHASLLLSNDTGPLHLALAIGTPSVGIYWLSNLVESGPLRQHLHRPAMAVRIHCPVCGMENLKTRCEHDVSFVEDVSLEEVLALTMDLWNSSQSTQRAK